jgi:hypothetical protein
MVYRILRNIGAVLLVTLLAPPVIMAGVLVAFTLVAFAVADVLSGVMEADDGEVGAPRRREPAKSGCECGFGCRHATEDGADFCWLVGGPARYGVGEREEAKHG